MSSSEQRVDVARHLSTFVLFVTNPEAPAKQSKTARRQRRSRTVGAKNTTKSSAYSEARCCMTVPSNCENNNEGVEDFHDYDE